MLRRIWRVAIKVTHRLGMTLASALALFRRRRSYVVERQPGIDEGDLAGKICVFAHFDRKGEVHAYVLHHLKALRRAGFSILFVSNAPCLSPSGAEELSRLVHRTLRRKNHGGYFGAYKDAITELGDLGQIDLLLLTNDSIYGPLFPLAPVLARISALHGHFWSLTDGWDRAYHLDSDFILFSREAISSPAFRAFWPGVRYVNSRNYIFRRYEVGLSQALIRAGLRGGALCNYRDLSRLVIDAVRSGALNEDVPEDDRKEHLRNIYELIQKGRPFNISAYMWDYLITGMGYPFIKGDLLQRRGATAPYISHWQRIVAKESSYDPDLIVRHLETTLKNRFT